MLKNKFSKVAKYAINIHKSVSFLYTNNEPPARNIKKTIPFTIPSKRTNYLAINLTKDTKDLYSENYKALVKKLKTQ